MSENTSSQPIIREQTLKHIAEDLGERGSGTEIVDWLKQWGVQGNLIEYPNTKWKMVFAVLNHYSHSTEKADHEMLFKIISEMLHPLRYDGNKKTAQAVADDFNNYLEYDGVVAMYSNDDKKYYVYKEDECGVDRDDTEYAMNEETFQQGYSEIEFLRQPENREKISTLRKVYQLFMNIVETFCENPAKPSHELNDAYIKTKRLITDIVSDYRTVAVNGKRGMQILENCTIPFNNLFTAEKEYAPDPFATVLPTPELSWDYIRPLMHATYGDIDDLYRRVDGSDVLSTPDVQQTLNDVSMLLSKIKRDGQEHVAMVKTIEFDEAESSITFNDKKITISKTKNSDPHYLLILLFKDKHKEFAYDEIWESSYFHSTNPEYDPKKDWRKIYNAAYSVNEKIAKITTIQDFLNVTKTTVSINKKYLD